MCREGSLEPGGWGHKPAWAPTASQVGAPAAGFKCGPASWRPLVMVGAARVVKEMRDKIQSLTGEIRSGQSWAVGTRRQAGKRLC